MLYIIIIILNAPRILFKINEKYSRWYFNWASLLKTIQVLKIYLLLKIII